MNSKKQQKHFNKTPINHLLVSHINDLLTC